MNYKKERFEMAIKLKERDRLGKSDREKSVCEKDICLVKGRERGGGGGEGRGGGGRGEGRGEGAIE